MHESTARPTPTIIEIQNVPNGEKIEQTSTRGQGMIELGEPFNSGSIDFSSTLGHLSIHTEGTVAGSQFNGTVFKSPEDIAAKVSAVLPETLHYDQHGRAELTVITKGEVIGYSGVKPLHELQGKAGITFMRAIRMPGGETAAVEGQFGAWYPEVTRNPANGTFETALNADGSVKNPYGKFEPEAIIALVDTSIIKSSMATDRLTVIIQKNPANNVPTALTIFPGENAPAFPAKIQTDGFSANTLSGGPEAAYWNDHAFIKPAENTL